MDGVRYFSKGVSTDGTELLYCRSTKRGKGLGELPASSVYTRYVIIDGRALHDCTRKDCVTLLALE